MANTSRYNAIQRRLVLLFVAILLYVLLLICAYVVNTFTLKADLLAVEDFFSLANNVLELRRYEKNLMFDVGKGNYDFFSHYFGLVDSDLQRLRPSMAGVVAEESIARIRRDFRQYGALVDQGWRSGSFDEARIRELGKGLVDFTQRLVAGKKQQIHRSLHVTTVVFVLLIAGGFVALLVLFTVQARSVLSRLALLRRATRDVVKGRFVPLSDDSAVKDEISALIQAFNRMVAEIESQHEQLLQAKKLAAIGTFSSGIAHELNNPLNNISLTADTLKEEFAELDEEEIRELIDDILIQTDRASTVVRNLLDFSRETAAEERLLDMREVVEKTVRLIHNQLRLQSIWVENYVPEDLPPVRADLQKLQQVFLNLFLNSIHAMPEGGLIHLDGRIEPEGYVCIEVSDTGCGIPADKLEHIFDPFYTTKGVGQGTGLGLSIVYGIVRRLKGYIEVRSKVNVGTTFAIHLPIAETGVEKDDGLSGGSA